MCTRNWGSSLQVNAPLWSIMCTKRHLSVISRGSTKKSSKTELFPTNSILFAIRAARNSCCKLSDSLHRKVAFPAFRRQKECLSAPKVAIREVRCPNGAFSAPEVVAREFWCQKECLSAPKVAFLEVRCQNGAFSAPEVMAREFWCQKECLSTPKVAIREVRCQNGAFSALGVVAREFWCPNGVKLPRSALC